jgi:lon-related putative ATP-dependent protease
MFFKRGAKDEPVSPATKAPVPVSGHAAVTVVRTTGSAEPERQTAALPPPALDASVLRRTVDPLTLGFKTTADLAPITGLIGQDRAMAAIEFGMHMRAHDYNIFVLGPPASGKRTAVKAQLALLAKAEQTPDDWVYVYNFDEPNRPRALRLPAGRAKPFAKGMIAALDELRAVIPAVIESDDYQARRRAIEAKFQSGQDEALETLSVKAKAQDIAILRTPQGFAFAPILDGSVVKPESFQMMPPAMQSEKQAQMAALETELATVLQLVPKADKLRRGQLQDLNHDMAQRAVLAALDELAAAMADLPLAVRHLEAASADLVRNIALFAANPEADEAPIRTPTDTARDPRYRRYLINVMVANGEGVGAAAQGAPVLEEINPVYANLIGRIEHIPVEGALMTDFLLLKAGALHRANGGTLVIDARKLLLSPFAYEALKRALKSREIRMEQPSDAAGLASVQTLDPEPIPLDVKVILIGEREIYYTLAQNDPDFLGLFKVQADFDDAIKRSSENDLAYARVIASIVREHGLNPLDASGVARIIEEGSRLADDNEKMSIEIGRLSDLVREADYWSRKAKRQVTTRDDVGRAVEAHIQRSDRMRDHALESINRDIVMVDVTGDKVGQINGLAVLQLGEFAFGRPSRITARVRMGSGRITDIEREAKLAGPLHTKGMMILWGYLAGRYAQDVPLALAASLVFEQSYGGVDGDSASSTELYALLSALSEVPIKQGFAVTGSVNQWGEVQAIGGVNEKIEGFFDVCRAKGLTGDQGVLVPRANVQHLMLRDDVVAAVKEGRFGIHGVSTIDHGIEILTGIAAGARGTGGQFPNGSVNARVEARLQGFAERARSFAKTGGGGAGV